MKSKATSVLAMLCLAVAGGVQAADIGDPVFPVDLGDKARAELVYENLNRDLDNGAELEADVYMLRIHTDVGQYAYLDFDLGGFDPSGGDLAFYGGVGLRYMAYDSEKARISPFAQIHFAPGVETDADEEFDFIDGDLGLTLAYKLKVDDQLTVTPYIGPVLSIIRVDSDVGDLEEDNIFGGVAGISLNMPGQNTFRVEARVVDGTSISAAAGIVF